MTRRIMIFLASARTAGNTARLAERSVAKMTAQVDWCDLTALPLPPFHDLRPNVPSVCDPALQDILRRMQLADDLVFAVPVYWYGLPAPAKLFLDHWSGFLDAPGTGFAEWIGRKRLWLMTCRADPDPAAALPIDATLQQTAQWLGMAWGGALHGVADQPGEIETDEAWALAPNFLALMPADGS